MGSWLGSKESNPRWRKRGRKEEEGAAGRQGSGGRRGKLRVPVGKKKRVRLGCFSRGFSCFCVCIHKGPVRRMLIHQRINSKWRVFNTIWVANTSPNCHLSFDFSYGDSIHLYSEINKYFLSRLSLCHRTAFSTHTPRKQNNCFIFL